MKFALLIALTFAPAHGKIDKARDRALIRCMVPIETIKSARLRHWCLKQSELMP